MDFKSMKPITYAIAGLVTVILILFSGVMLILLGGGGAAGAVLNTQFLGTNNPYEIYLNEEIFYHLEKNNIPERQNNVLIPRLVLFTIVELLYELDIGMDALDLEDDAGNEISIPVVGERITTEHGVGVVKWVDASNYRYSVTVEGYGDVIITNKRRGYNFCNSTSRL